MPVYKDIDIEGRTTSNGNILTYTNNEALGNAIKFYLLSSKGAFIRQPTTAGILDTLLFRPLNPIYPEEKAGYLSQIRNTFNNFSTILSLDITPDYENQSWNVRVKWLSLLTKETIISEVKLRTELPPQEQLTEYLSVILTGESLYYFILSEQITMPDIKLEYIEETGYIWGKYLFINFIETDPYYSQIIDLIG